VVDRMLAHFWEYLANLKDFRETVAAKLIEIQDAESESKDATEAKPELIS